MSVTHDVQPMSLAAFALRRAGPREALITLSVNLVVAWAIWRNQREVPLSGGFSMAVLWGIMVWMVGACSTFFGVCNGATARKRRQAGRALAADTPWLLFAVLAGMVAGWSCLIVFSLLYRFALQTTSATTTTVVLAVVGQGVLAGVLGYAMQSLGVLLSGWLGETSSLTMVNTSQKARP